MLTPTLSKSTLARGAGLLVLAALTPTVRSLTNYANDFVDPEYIVGRKFPANTVIAQKTIVQWADQYAALGPWSVSFAFFISSQGNFPDALKLQPSRCHEQECRPTHGGQTYVHELVAVLVARLFKCREHYYPARE